VLLSTEDGYATITDGEANYGTIAAGASLENIDGFGHDVLNDIPDMHSIVFNLESTGDDIWTSSFTEKGHAPVLSYGGYAISDASGNGNGKLDPGEIVELTVTVNNDGSADAVGVVGLLGASSAYVQVDGGSMTYGDIAAGGTSDQVYSVTAGNDTPAGHIAPFVLDLTATLGIIGQGAFAIVVGQIPVLVVDLDGNNNSADVMMDCFSNLSVAAETVSSIPANLDLYSSVFICLGIYPDNSALSSADGQKLADYLDAGGNVYMEGGDTWYYDDATPVRGMFNINGLEDGVADLGFLEGQAGTFTDGLEFSHVGENGYIDHIAPIGSAFMIFENQSPAFNTAVAYDEGSYKTIGSSFEFGGLGTGPSNVDYLMHQYLVFFGIDAIWVGVDDLETSNISFGRAYPNPFTGETHIAFQVEESMNVNVEVYNMNGQKITSLANNTFPVGQHTLTWNAAQDGVSEGIYFFRMVTEKEVITRKVILMH
jgi:hypothetical protein